MTIFEAVEMCDRQKPNGYSTEDKIHWLSKLDMMIYREIISQHEGGTAEFKGYAPDADGDTVLLVDDAFSDVYIKWLFAQIDFANAEMQRYNNSVMMFNMLYEEFAGWYTREHMPIQRAYIRGARRRGRAVADTF